jgi:DNA-binding MarR family transcriptional regulator
VLLLLHVVSPAVFCVTLSLQVNPRSCKLAEALHVNESTVTRNLEKLEKKELITRTPEKRKKIISVTKKGAEIAQNIMDIDEKWDSNIKKSLTDEEFENFRNILIKICEDLK